MKVIAKNTGNKMVDMYTALPGQVVTHGSCYYLVARVSPSMFKSDSIMFINVQTGGAVCDPRGMRFLICDNAELHVSVLEV